MFSSFIDQLKIQLTLALPGEEVQFEMAHVNREKKSLKKENLNHFKISAVLLFIYPDENNAPSFILIQRPAYDGFHSSQIGLPGGKLEPIDNDIASAALREFKEEIGCEEVPNLIGECSEIFIPVSNFIVHPFVGYLDYKPIFKPDEREVAEIIECKIETLLNPEIIKETIVKPHPTLSFKTPYFEIENKVVWGATAMILNEFKAIALNSFK